VLAFQHARRQRAGLLIQVPQDCLAVVSRGGDHELLTGQQLEPTRMPTWDLARRNGQAVPGMAYRATVTAIVGIPIGRQILVAGYNHNLQSSYGVSATARAAISEWITVQYRSCSGTQPSTTAAVPG
jgi:hypothetical protein